MGVAYVEGHRRQIVRTCVQLRIGQLSTLRPGYPPTQDQSACRMARGIGVNLRSCVPRSFRVRGSCFAIRHSPKTKGPPNPAGLSTSTSLFGRIRMMQRLSGSATAPEGALPLHAHYRDLREAFLEARRTQTLGHLLHHLVAHLAVALGVALHAHGQRHVEEYGLHLRSRSSSPIWIHWRRSRGREVRRVHVAPTASWRSDARSSERSVLKTSPGSVAQAMSSKRIVRSMSLDIGVTERRLNHVVLPLAR